jgi:hypothetical protein
VSRASARGVRLKVICGVPHTPKSTPHSLWPSHRLRAEAAVQATSLSWVHVINPQHYSPACNEQQSSQQANVAPASERI